MPDTDFLVKKQEAIERMRDFERMGRFENGKAAAPPFVRLPKEEKPERAEKANLQKPFSLDFLSLDLPFLERLKTDKDMGLILGLILILLCENTDKLTLIALVYILL